jgi:hypothetical protein
MSRRNSPDQPLPQLYVAGGSIDVDDGHHDEHRAGDHRAAPAAVPRSVPPTPHGGLAVPAEDDRSDLSTTVSSSALHNAPQRRMSRVIISDEPGGISLRRISVDDRPLIVTTHGSGMLRPAQSFIGDASSASSHSPRVVPAAHTPKSVHTMTPVNDNIEPSLGEMDYPLRRSGTVFRITNDSVTFSSGAQAPNNGSGTQVATSMTTGDAGTRMGPDADEPADDGVSDAGSIVENTFAFIAVENDRLERERVIALIDSSYLTWRHRWFCILEGRPHDKDEWLSVAFNCVSVIFVLGSCVVFCVQSLPENTNAGRKFAEDPLFWGETACTIFFVFEIVWRIICVPLSHLFAPFFFIDLITIVGYFSDIVADVGTVGTLSQALRLLRVFRVFKLSRYSTSLQMVFAVLRSSVTGLSMLVMPLLLVATSFSAMIYLAEVWDATWDGYKRQWFYEDGTQPVIQSIPDALWTTFMTMTTVGYGDVVPQTVVGKIFCVTLMFLGVLFLSFPNIVLGANLQVAFRRNKQVLMVSAVTRRIRKVGHALAFIRRTLYWVAVRKAREAARTKRARGGSGSPESGNLSSLAGLQRDLAIRANYAFFPTSADFEAHRKPGVEPVTPANVRHWTLRGVDPIHLLQIMLEVYSGVATCEELYTELQASGLSPDTRRKDVGLVLMYLAEAQIVRLFILERNTTHMVAALMDCGITELLLHTERGDRNCKRSAEYARFVWKQTTGQLVPYSLALLFNAYTTWSRRERFAEDDTVADLRTTIDMPEEVRNLLYEQPDSDVDTMASSGRAGGSPGLGIKGKASALSRVFRPAASRRPRTNSELDTFGADSPSFLKPAEDLRMVASVSTRTNAGGDMNDALNMLRGVITESQRRRETAQNNVFNASQNAVPQLPHLPSGHRT